MRASRADGVRIRGIASAVPDEVIAWEEEAAVFGEAEMRKIAANTEIKRRRIAPAGVCTSDLCIAAAVPLLEKLGVERESIETLIFVTQTADYVLPATACSIASRLGLSTGCAAFDINLGCSGYAYGLWMAAHLIQGGAARRVLLLAGETPSKIVHAQDRSARPLFGDAGTATLLDACTDADSMHFRFGTDGSGQNNLLIPAGGQRLGRSEKTCLVRRSADGNSRSLEKVFMDGAEIFSFTLERVPPLLLQTAEDAGWKIEDVDYFVLHQANGFILRHLARFAGIPSEKVPIALQEYGNTSSASIPLALTTSLRDRMAAGPMNLVLAGFGVGYSWCAAAFQAEGVEMLPLVEVDCRQVLSQLYGANSEASSHLPVEIRNAFADGS